MNYTFQDVDLALASVERLLPASSWHAGYNYSNTRLSYVGGRSVLDGPEITVRGSNAHEIVALLEILLSGGARTLVEQARKPK